MVDSPLTDGHKLGLPDLGEKSNRNTQLKIGKLMKFLYSSSTEDNYKNKSF